MDDIQHVARRYQRRRRATDQAYAELVPLILEARKTQSLRAVAALTGLSFGRIHQIEQEAGRD